jgi:hypothetical protein
MTLETIVNNIKTFRHPEAVVELLQKPPRSVLKVFKKDLNIAERVITTFHCGIASVNPVRAAIAILGFAEVLEGLVIHLGKRCSIKSMTNDASWIYGVIDSMKLPVDEIKHAIMPLRGTERMLYEDVISGLGRLEVCQEAVRTLLDISSTAVGFEEAISVLSDTASLAANGYDCYTALSMCTDSYVMHGAAFLKPLLQCQDPETLRGTRTFLKKLKISPVRNYSVPRIEPGLSGEVSESIVRIIRMTVETEKVDDERMQTVLKGCIQALGFRGTLELVRRFPGIADNIGKIFLRYSYPVELVQMLVEFYTNGDGDMRTILDISGRKFILWILQSPVENSMKVLRTLRHVKDSAVGFACLLMGERLEERFIKLEDAVMAAAFSFDLVYEDVDRLRKKGLVQPDLFSVSERRTP